MMVLQSASLHSVTRSEYFSLYLSKAAFITSSLGTVRSMRSMVLVPLDHIIISGRRLTRYVGDLYLDCYRLGSILPVQTTGAGSMGRGVCSDEILVADTTKKLPLLKQVVEVVCLKYPYLLLYSKFCCIPLNSEVTS